MPASLSMAEDTAGVIDAAVLKTLGGNIDKRLIASSKRVLVHNIDFVPSTKPHGIELNKLKSKYITLNPTGSDMIQQIQNNGPKEHNDGLPDPKFVIHPEESIKLSWVRECRVGCGLVNLGNTCFLNSTLQCLSYTPPLANYCFSDQHTRACKRNGFCMMCELQHHLRRSLHGGHPIRPESILQKLHLISKSFHRGRQEDAHEFLRYVIDHMQKATLPTGVKLDRFSKATTVIDQIFTGYLRSQVICTECREKFNTYDPFMDIGLDIKNATTLEDSFKKFGKKEVLEHDNAYMCPSCKRKVRAIKQLLIHKPSNVLTIQLKRFDHTKMFSKITRHIPFATSINIRPFMSNTQGDSVIYQLYGVLVHSGGSVHMGHYYCYVRSASGAWYLMNDSVVQPVTWDRVSTAEAYLLFYVRKAPCATKTVPVHKSPGGVMEAQSLNQTCVTNGPKLVNGAAGPRDVGVLLPRKTFIPNQLVKKQLSAATKTSQQPSAIAASTERHKISFGVRPLPVGKERTPVKYSNSIISSMGNKLVLDVGEKVGCKSGLVPYGGDSDDDSESHEGSTDNVRPDQAAKRNIENGIDGGVGRSDVNKGDASKEVEVCGSVGVKKVSPSKVVDKSSVIFDAKLNATTSVAGNIAWISSRESDVSKSECDMNERTNDIVSKVKVAHVNNDAAKTVVIKGDKAKIDERGDAGKWEFDVPRMDVSHSNGGNKEVMMKPGSLEKKSRLDSALLCNTSPQKINSSSHWQVQTQESLKSPSISSNCSNASVNSTTEWQVIDSDLSRSIDASKCAAEKRKFSTEICTEKRKFSADFSVECTPKILRLSQKHERRVEKDIKCEDEQTPMKDDLLEIKSTERLLDKKLINHTTKNLHKKKDHDTLLHRLFNKSKTGDKAMKQADKAERSNIKFQRLVDESHSDDKSVKKHKKDKRKEKERRASSRECQSSESGDESSRHSKEQKRKRSGSLKRKRDRTDSESSAEYQWVERTDFSGSQSCAESSDSQALTVGEAATWGEARRTEQTFPKTNGHWKVESVSPCKSKQRGDMNGQVEATSVNTLNGEREHNNGRDGLIASRSNGASVKEHANEGDSSHNKPVLVQKWDKIMPKRHRYLGETGQSDGPTDDLLTELDNMSSAHGYGNSVPSWSGGVSQVDEDVAREKRDMPHESESYDDEIDMGKTKKIKTHKSANISCGNLFQSFYDKRREGKSSDAQISKKSDYSKPKNLSPHFKERRF